MRIFSRKTTNVPNFTVSEPIESPQYPELDRVADLQARIDVASHRIESLLEEAADLRSMVGGPIALDQDGVDAAVAENLTNARSLAHELRIAAEALETAVKQVTL